MTIDFNFEGSKLDYTNVLLEICDYRRFNDDSLSFTMLQDLLQVSTGDPVEPDRLGEELDYLLISGIIEGDDRDYRLTDLWWELSEEERDSWFNLSGKSAIVDPVPLNNDNPRNTTRARDRYEWERKISSQFTIAMKTSDLYIPPKIAVLSGSYLNPCGHLVMQWSILERIQAAVKSWQQTESGSDFTRGCGGKISLDDLGAEIHPDLRTALANEGIYGLAIDEWELLENAWTYDREF